MLFTNEMLPMTSMRLVKTDIDGAGERWRIAVERSEATLYFATERRIRAYGVDRKR
jgi:hypothetical protein